MLVTFKTLDHKIFKLDIDPEETVSDLKTRLEDDMGKDNIYKLIYSGKILKDENLLSSYNINEKHFVVLMVTKAKIINANLKDTSKDTINPNVSVNEDEILPSTSTSSQVTVDNKDVDEDIIETNKEIKKEVNVEPSVESENHKNTEITEQANAIVGLDWVEQQIKEKENHFVTEREFAIALDVVMTTEYLADDGHIINNLEVITKCIDDYFKYNAGFEEVKKTVINNINDILTVNPNIKQLEAFLSDISGIYSQERSRDNHTVVMYHSEDDEEDSEEAAEPIITAFDRNVDNIVAMGFIREEVELALRAAFNNPDQAVDYLVGGIPPSAFPPENNPLAFLRNNEEFQHIRYLVQSNPAMLQSLLLSFGQKHPELMDCINKNKGTFVRMLHEPDGAKGFGDDGSIVVDSINNQGNSDSHQR